ncbi:hypothetical protein HK099_004578 [Clydaea vesicula]|uniref:DNA polymerase n=1 Tax=Clydaea vesicula TaxID=447962 RepID=A0AAD5U039_9FUNG|nr:hypothetical protein HK099_004578 [Clydaea vesicula]
MNRYKILLAKGWCPIWVGIEYDEHKISEHFPDGINLSHQRLLDVKLGRTLDRIYVSVPFTMPDSSHFIPLIKHVSDEPGLMLSVFPVSTHSDVSFLRAASICGIGPLSLPGYGISNILTNNLTLRVIGLDIEQTTFYRDGQFPLPHDPLVSIAISTWDGRNLCRTTCGRYDTNEFPHSLGYDVKRLDSSSAIVQWAINFIEINNVDFVCIHSGYGFDIPRMCVHSYPGNSNNFEERNLGRRGKGYDLLVRGATAIDTYWYLDKTHRSDYESLRLDDIAEKHGLGGKVTAPPMNIDVNDDSHDLTDMIYYNMYDSYLHMAIAIKSGCLDEIITLSAFSKCPTFDSARYLTGTMAATLVSSLSLASGKIMDFSPDPRTSIRIEGARVFEPKLGYHKDILLLDFSSLYPSIMIATNISTETVKDFSDCLLLSKIEQNNICGNLCISSLNVKDAITWNVNHIYTFNAGMIAKIDRYPISSTTAALKFLMEERSKESDNPKKNWSLKVSSNSIYGAYGASTSPMYNYLAASSVTLVGRWMISLTEAIGYMCGYESIYGDTDSVFLKSIKSKSIGYISFLKILKNILKFTPFYNFDLKLEAIIDNILISGKKYYVWEGRKAVQNKITGEYSFKPASNTKGMATRRKDRDLIVKNCIHKVVNIIFSDMSHYDKEHELSKYFTIELERIRIGAFKFSEVVKERRKGGDIYVEFVNEAGEVVLINKDVFNPNVHKPSRDHLEKSIIKSCDKILSVARFPGVKDLTRKFMHSKLEIGIHGLVKDLYLVDMQSYLLNDDIVNEDVFREELILHNSETINNVNTYSSIQKLTWKEESAASDTLNKFLSSRILCQEYAEHFCDLSSLPTTLYPPESWFLQDKYIIMVPRLYDPLCGYPISIQGDYYTICQTPSFNVQDMERQVSILAESRQCWTFKALSLHKIDRSSLLGKIAKCYSHNNINTVPMHIFDITCLNEMKSQTIDKVWKDIYSGLSDNVRHTGIYGTLQDNTLIDLRSYEVKDGQPVNENEQFDPNLRSLCEHFSGILDCTYTPTSPDAGNLRSVVHGVRYRIVTPKLLSRCRQLISIISKDLIYDDYEDDFHNAKKEIKDIINKLVEKGAKTSWLMHFMGVVINTNIDKVAKIIHLWLKMSGPCRPSLHTFCTKNVLSLSVTSGCAIRPVSIVNIEDKDLDLLYWIDSLVFNNSTMMYVYGYNTLVTRSAREYMKTFMHMIPYVFNDQAPRPLLASAMSIQAISKPKVEMMSTVVSQYSTFPILRTPLMNAICNDLKDCQSVSIPGFPLLVAFINMRMNYEDSVIISSKINKLKVFSHNGYVCHPYPKSAKDVAVGSTIGPNVEWWRPGHSGVVIGKGHSSSKTAYCIAEMKSKVLEIGDKIATWHGQKFVISQILDEDELPTCIDVKSGKKFKPHIIVASSSIHNRGTIGQIYEAWKTFDLVKSYDFDPKALDTNLVLQESDENSIPPAYTCNVQYPKSQTLVSRKDSNNKPVAIRADYGICNFWPLCHLSRDKQQFLSSVPNSISIPRGRLKGSPVRFGEMEIVTLMMNGYVNVLEELMEGYDLAIVPICSMCRRLSILCDCKGSHPPITDVVTRASLVKTDICRAIYTFHMGECYKKRTFSEHSSSNNSSYSHMTLSPEFYINLYGKPNIISYENNEYIEDDEPAEPVFSQICSSFVYE